MKLTNFFFFNFPNKERNYINFIEENVRRAISVITTVYVYPFLCATW